MYGAWYHELRAIQGRPGTARTRGPGDLWHGLAQNISWPGKSWHGPAQKILARKIIILAGRGTNNNCHQLFFLGAQGPSPARPRPDFGNLGTWKSRNLGSGKLKKWKLSKSKSLLPKMWARSGSAGKKSSRPHLGPSHAIFSMDRKNPKNAKFLPIFLGGCPIFLGGCPIFLGGVFYMPAHVHF